MIDSFETAVNKGADKLKEETILEDAARKFKEILRKQLVRVEDMKAQGDFVDYTALETIRIGVCGGDGIGPIISAEYGVMTVDIGNPVLSMHAVRELGGTDDCYYMTKLFKAFFKN